MPLIKAFLFGATIALSVGPIALLIFNNGLVYGRAAATRSALGAALGDFVYALLAFLFGSLLIGELSRNQSNLRWFSAVVLIGFGAYMCYSAIRSTAIHADRTRNPPSGVWTTFTLTMVNPMTIIAFAAFAGQISGWSTMSPFVLACAVFAGSLMVQLAWALFGSSLGRFLTRETHVLTLRLASGLGIVGFGLAGLVTA